MEQNVNQIVNGPHIDNVGRQVWAAKAAHRFAQRTALAPRPKYRWWIMPLVRAGLASQLNRWPRAVREGIGGAASAFSTDAGAAAPAEPHSALQRAVRKCTSRYRLWRLSTCGGHLVYINGEELRL